MLVILLAERADRGPGVWFSTTEFPNRYRISAPTRSRGTKELTEHGLLRTRRVPLSKPNDSQIFDQRKIRKLYRLTGTAASLGTQPGMFWEIQEHEVAQVKEPKPEGEAKPKAQPVTLKKRKKPKNTNSPGTSSTSSAKSTPPASKQ